MSATVQLVKKASGHVVPFSNEKLIASLRRTGASKETAEQIVQEVEAQLYPGISTKKIYRIAFSLLKKLKQPVAARYKLKQAIMQLGPTGFPFELFISKLLQYQGYTVVTGSFVTGRCVTHEIDIIAEDDQKKCIIECKFHNRQGVICDVKIPLYVQSRFIDVKEKWMQQKTDKTSNYQGWIITNTRFTTDAIKYAECSNLYLIGWDYPQQHNLKTWIDKSGLYPVTCLTSITLKEKQLLMDDKIILANELKKGVSLLVQNGISNNRLMAALNEAEELSKPMLKH